MAETHGFKVVLLVFLEKLLLTNSKGIVTFNICLLQFLDEYFTLSKGSYIDALKSYCCV